MLHAVYAVSTIARGRVASLDVAAAKAHPGVVAVITPGQPSAAGAATRTPSRRCSAGASRRCRTTACATPTSRSRSSSPRRWRPRPRARACSRPTYEAEPARIGFDGGVPFDRRSRRHRQPRQLREGRPRRRRSPPPRRRTETEIETPIQYHNAMEPHAIVAAWDGDRLTIDTPNQAIAMAQARFAAFFGIPAENVTIRSPFLGGGFGSKAILAGPQILAVLAARMLGRPVKLVLPPRPDVRARSAIAARRASGCGSAMDARRAADGARARGRRDDQQLRRFPRAGGQRLAQPLRQPGDRDQAHGRARRYRHAGPDARAGRGHAARRRSNARSTRRPRPAASTRSSSACATTPRSIPATGKPFSSKALRECYAQARRALRLGRPAARAAADARRRRPAGRLGHGQRAVPGADVPRRGPRRAARRRHRPRRDRGRRHGAGRLDGARPDRRRRARPARSTRSSSAPAIPTIPTAASPAARATPRPRAARLQRRQRRDRQARRARDRPPGLAALRRRQRRRRGARRAPAPPRATRAAARAMPTSSRAPASRSSRDAAGAPATRPTRRPGRCSRTARSSPRSRSIPISARSGSAVSSAPSRPGGSSTRTWRAASSAAA